MGTGVSRRAGRRMGRPASPLPALAVLALAAMMPGAAWAQARGVVERNLPPPVTGGGGLRLGPGPSAAGDDAPLGVTLSGIRLIGPSGTVAARPAEGSALTGITLTGIEGVDPERLKAALAPFPGRPLSRRLIADVQAVVARVYRDAGRPFVSVTAPPQDISAGVLQLRVIPFRLGAVGARGAAGAPSAPRDGELAQKLRAEPGTLIDAPRLSEDIDWINRYPYRQVNGVFEPGTRPGDSDLTLEVTRQKPWQAYAGWSNTGTRETDYNRYFVGLGLGLEALNDTTLSYQLTGSGNFWSDPSRIDLSGPERPSYLSHAGRVVIPTLDRQAIEIAPSFVATSQTGAGGILTFNNTTFELPILYRSAVSNLAPDLVGWGEVYGGASPKWLSRDTFFQGIEVADGTAGVFDLILGWANQVQDAGTTMGTTTLDLRLVANPGGVVGGNDAATWFLFTNGRVSGINYVYASGTLDRTTPLAGLLPGLEGFSLRNTLYAQVAGQALPDTEQLALGGYYATRGYTLSDGSVDAGFVLRNELRTPALALLTAPGADNPAVRGLADAASPYLFLDIAYGHNYGLGGTPAGDDPDTTLVGVGAGLDYTLGRHLQAALVAGIALTDGPLTSAGDITIQGRIVFAP